MLAITKLSDEHSHELADDENVKLYAQKRKLTDEEEGIVRDMIRGGGDAKLIAEVIHEKTGKIILPKQVHNVKHVNDVPINYSSAMGCDKCYLWHYLDCLKLQSASKNWTCLSCL